MLWPIGHIDILGQLFTLIQNRSLKLFTRKSFYSSLLWNSFQSFIERDTKLIDLQLLLASVCRLNGNIDLLRLLLLSAQPDDVLCSFENRIHNEVLKLASGLRYYKNITDGTVPYSQRKKKTKKKKTRNCNTAFTISPAAHKSTENYINEVRGLVLSSSKKN